jgi:hypothetical protein
MVGQQHTGQSYGRHAEAVAAARALRGERGNPSRRNPSKAQRAVAAQKRAVERRVAVALAKFLKQANPAMKTSGATIQRLKGGAMTIRPIKATRGRR